jgi:hypothetical protein
MKDYQGNNWAEIKRLSSTFQLSKGYGTKIRDQEYIFMNM